MEEFVPELGAVGEGEGGEEKVDVDARAEGDVDCGGEVGGEEDDSFEVFEFAEEDLGAGISWFSCFGRRNGDGVLTRD